MGNNLWFLIILIIPIGLIVFFIIKKKKGNTANKVQRKEERDEVWATIKKYLKQNNEMGKEVIDTFTVKRPNPFDKSTMTKEQRTQAKIKEQELEKLKTTNPEEYKKQKARIALERKRKPKELYVVLFTTQDPKTKKVDEPRAIECEVILKKVAKNKTERTITINGLLDYEKEMQWIKPIKDKEDKQYQKQLERQQRYQAKKEKRQSK